MEPHVWRDIVYIRLTQFENNAIWQKRQVDEMPVVSFFFFFGITVEWVEYNHGKAESWPRFLALLLTSRVIQDKRHGFNPTFIIQEDLRGDGCKGWYRAPTSSFFIRLEGYPVDNIQATCAPANLPSGQAVKRELFIKTKPWILLILELCRAAGHGTRVEAWESVIRKVWKWVRRRHKCPKAWGKLQGPGATEETQNQNTRAGSMQKSKQWDKLWRWSGARAQGRGCYYYSFTYARSSACARHRS